MRRATNKPSHGEKTRYLNIVYFVESARSHTIRINLTYARWALALLLVAGVWSISSLFWIAHLKYQSAKTHERLEQALTTIFDYQIKNQKIFDEAYPPEATNGYYSELAQLPSNNPIADADATKEKATQVSNNQKPDDKTNASQIANKAPPQTQSKTQPQAPSQQQSQSGEAARKSPNSSTQSASLAAVPSTSSATSNVQSTSISDSSTSALEISGTKLSKADGRIYLNFNMKNKYPQRAEGFIWAVAIIAQENGELKHIAAPLHTRIDSASGEIIAPKSGYRFSILKFKNKEFDFKAPSKANWKLSKLTIHYTNLEGRNEQEVKIPVEQVAITNVADTPATDIAL